MFFAFPSRAKARPTTYTAALSSSSNATQVIKAHIDKDGFGIIDGKITWSGAGGAGTFTVGLPSGWTINTSDLPGGTSVTNQGVSMLGYGYWFDSGNGWLFIYPIYASTTTISFAMNTQVLNGSQLASGDAINFYVRLPLV